MKPNLLWLALVLVIAWATPAYAYIDPSSGGILIQLLFGGVAGLAVLAKLFWHRLKTLGQSDRRGRGPEASTGGAGSSELGGDGAV